MKITAQQRQAAWSTLTSAASRARELATAAADRTATIRQSTAWSDTHKTDLIKQVEEDLAEQLQTLTDEAAQARDTLTTAARELSQPHGDSTAQLLAETQRGRAWDRVRPQLDAGRPLEQILDAAVRDHDAATLAALRTEMPAWMEARQQRPSGLASLEIGPVDTTGLLRRLDVATVRALGNDQGIGTAARLRLHADTMYPVAEASIAAARTGNPRGTLQTALAVKVAQQAADRVRADLGEAPATSDSGNAA